MNMLYDNSSIFHHTNKFPNLAKILQGGSFKVQYCTEKIYISKNTFLHIMVPMVSFADIRLTDYVRSFRQRTESGEYALGYYGDYAIGLSKDWAIPKNVCPIIYVPKPQNNLAKNHFLYPLKPFAQRRIEDGNLGSNIPNLPYIASFCKHYSGVLENRTGNKEIYSFHNEQEWRFVPSDLNVKWNLFNSRSDANYSIQKQKKDALNKRLKKNLEFDLWKDVTHIVVKSDAFIERVVEIIEKRKNKELREHPLNAADINKRFHQLCARIITTDNLSSDL